MTGISYTVTIDDADLRKKTGELIDRMKNREGFYKNVGEYLLPSIQDNFEGEHAPDGTRWKGLSGVTIAKRLQDHGNAPLTILRVSGGLVGSINYEPGSDALRIGTSKVQAAILHFGGKAGRNHKVTIPARPYLGISAENERGIFEIAEDWLTVE